MPFPFVRRQTMKIKKYDLFGYPTIEFEDSIGSSCTLWIAKSTKCLRIDLSQNDFPEFSQDQIKALLPYLQAFVETSELTI